MKARTYDFRSFCRGELVRTDIKHVNYKLASLSVLGVGIDHLIHPVQVEAVSVMANADTTSTITIDHAFDPVITMLQQMAFPVATICIAWACLEAMIGKPASAVSRAKWAALGYIAMRYVPDLLRHI